MTQVVNSGDNGLEDRRQYYERCLIVFSNFNESNVDNQSDVSASWLKQYSVSYGFGTYDLSFNDGDHFGMDWDTFVVIELKSITDGTVVSAV